MELIVKFAVVLMFIGLGDTKPQATLTEVEPFWCVHIAVPKCAEENIAKECKIECMKVDDPYWCTYLEITKCAEEDVSTQCKMKCKRDDCTEGSTWTKYCNTCICLNRQSICTNKDCVTTSRPTRPPTSQPTRRFTPGDCPKSKGFIQTPDGTECFISIMEKRTWEEADNYCMGENMMLAEPSDNNTVWLQKRLNEKYGGDHYWIGLKGTGSGSYFWQRGGGQLPNNNNLWAPGKPDQGGDADDCVGMSTWDSRIRSTPGKLYFDRPCSWSNYHICQSELQPPFHPSPHCPPPLPPPNLLHNCH